MKLKDVRELFSFKSEDEKRSFFFRYLTKREKDFESIGFDKKSIVIKEKKSKDKKVTVTAEQYKLLKTLKLV